MLLEKLSRGPRRASGQGAADRDSDLHSKRNEGSAHLPALAHILPALAFVVLAPFVYLRRFAGAGWPDRLLFPLGIVVGATAYAMSVYSVGGWVERSAVLFFNSLFLFSLARAWQLRRGEPRLKLLWMTRAIAILLGIATTRPVMGIFFATSPLTQEGQSQIERMAMRPAA